MQEMDAEVDPGSDRQLGVSIGVLQEYAERDDFNSFVPNVRPDPTSRACVRRS